MRAKSVHKILQKPVLKTGVHSISMQIFPVIIIVGCGHDAMGSDISMK